MLAYVFRPWQQRVLSGLSFWTTTHIDRCLLLKSSWTLDLDAEYVADLVPATHEVDATGYERLVVTRPLTVQVDYGSNIVELHGDPVSFGLMTGATGADAPRYAVFYDYSSSDASAEVALVWDFEAGLDVDGKQLTLRSGNGGADPWVRFISNPASVTP